MRWLSLLLVILVMVSAGFFLIKTLTPPSKVAVQTAALDGYMLEANYTQYNEQGDVHTHLYTPKMTHYSEDKTAYFESPVVTAFTNEHIPWTIRAKHGKSIRDGEKVQVWDNIIIHQPSRPGHPETTITTSAMTIYPKRAYAQTQQVINIIRPNARIRATGMQAYFKEGIFKLLSEVSGAYQPPPAQSNG